MGYFHHRLKHSSFSSSLCLGISKKGKTDHFKSVVFFVDFLKGVKLF